MLVLLVTTVFIYFSRRSNQRIDYLTVLSPIKVAVLWPLDFGLNPSENFSCTSSTKKAGASP